MGGSRGSSIGGDGSCSGGGEDYLISRDDVREAEKINRGQNSSETNERKVESRKREQNANGEDKYAEKGERERETNKKW